MAKGYYPRLWNKQRLAELVKAGRLTEAAYEELTGELMEATPNE